MNDNEIDINHFATCIEAINNVSNIAEADELKTIVNNWINDKLNAAISDNSTSMKLFTAWKKATGQSGSEDLIQAINLIDKIDSAGMDEFREAIHGVVKSQLNQAMPVAESKLLFFKIWLGLKPEVTAKVERVTLPDEPTPELPVLIDSPDQSELSSTGDDESGIPSRQTVDLSKTNWPWS